MKHLTSDARTDMQDFWRLNDVLTAKRLPHTPFLVVEVMEDGHPHVSIVDNITELLVYPRSDFFQFTVGDARAAKAAVA